MAKEKISMGKEPKAGEKSRGTQDELEILRMIISENRGLMTRVLDKIRQYRVFTADKPLAATAVEGKERKKA